MYGEADTHLLAHYVLHHAVTPRRRLPKISVSDAVPTGLVLSSNATAAVLRGIVRATPDFMCAAGTFHRVPSISPHVAWMTSPVLGQQASNSSSSARAAASGRWRDLGEEAWQLPPQHGRHVGLRQPCRRLVHERPARRSTDCCHTIDF